MRMYGMDDAMENALAKAFIENHLRVKGMLPINSPQLKRILAILAMSPEVRELEPKPTLQQMKIFYARRCGSVIRRRILKESG